MVNKKLLILTLAVLTATSGFAVSSLFEISVGGGWSSLGYSLKIESQPELKFSQPGDFGLSAHVGYGLQFNKYVGLGIGVDFARYGANSKISGHAVWQGISDSDGEKYDHHLVVSNWSDKQTVYMVEIPLSVYLRYPVSTDLRVYAQIGAKASIPVHTEAIYSGSLSHQGFYEPWMLTLYDMPEYGFYSADIKEKYNVSAKFTMAAFVKIGIEGPVDELQRVWLFGAIYGSMHFIPVLSDLQMSGIKDHLQMDNSQLSTLNSQSSTPNSQSSTLNSQSSTPNSQLSILNSQFSILNSSPNPIAAGVEIGVRFRIPHPKRFRSPCRCETE